MPITRPRYNVTATCDNCNSTNSDPTWIIVTLIDEFFTMNPVSKFRSLEDIAFGPCSKLACSRLCAHAFYLQAFNKILPSSAEIKHFTELERFDGQRFNSYDDSNDPHHF